MPMVDLTLAVVAEQGVDLVPARSRRRPPHDWAGRPRRAAGPRGRWGASANSGKKCGSRAATSGIDGEEARGPVVGMEAVAAPRIVAQHHRRPQRADDPGHVPSLVDSVARVRRPPVRGTGPGRDDRSGSTRSTVDDIGCGLRLLLACSSQGAPGRRRGPSCPWTRRSGPGGGGGTRPRPTWPAWPRTRTRCRRGGPRWPEHSDGTAKVDGDRTGPGRSPTGSPLPRAVRRLAHPFTGPGSRTPPPAPRRRARRCPRPGQVGREPGREARAARPRPGDGRTSRVRRRTGSRHRPGRAMTLVPFPLRSGTRVMPDCFAHQGQVGGPGQVGVGHRDLGHALGHQMVDAGLDRSVEPPSRFPHHQRPASAGPLGHIGVVTHHGHRQRMGRTHHPIGHGPGQIGALRSAQGQMETTLGLIEGLDRNQHRPWPDRQRISRSAGPVGRVCHRVSVGGWSQTPPPAARPGPNRSEAASVGGV